MEHKGAVLEHEVDSLEEPSLLNQGPAGEKTREEVDPKHHLYTRHVVGLVEFSLPVGGETIKGHVTYENNNPRDSGHCTPTVLLTL